MASRIFGESTVRSLLATSGANPDAIDQLLDNAESLELSGNPESVGDPAAVMRALERAHAHRAAVANVLDPANAPDDEEIVEALIEHVGGFLLQAVAAIAFAAGRQPEGR